MRVVFIIAWPFIWLFTKIHDKLMFKFLNQSYIYNVSWEDPRIDHTVFHLKEDDHIITIASAGDNVFDYLIEGSSVTAVDFNSCQIALTEIKALACQEIDFEDFFAIFSRSDIKLLKKHYQETLREKLTEPTRKFWDSYINKLTNFMYSGTSGWTAWVLFRLIFPMFGLGFIRKMILRGAPMEEIRDELRKKIHRIRWLCWFGDKVCLKVSACFAGVPTLQLQLGLQRDDNTATCLDRIFFQTDLVKDNYFYAGYFLGEYMRDNAPRYLQEQHYPALRKSLKANKLRLHHGTMQSVLEAAPENHFTVASLLDHMDWMTASQINEELALLMNCMDRKRGRIYWRSFSDGVHSAPLRYLQPVQVDDTTDRVGMYWSTWIAHLKDTPFTAVFRNNTEYSTSLGSMLKTGFQIVSFPLIKPFIRGGIKDKAAAASSTTASSSSSSSSDTSDNKHQKDMEMFYKHQKDEYDNFREKMLHARPVLLDILPIKESTDMVWVDIGGGTARNLEFLPVEVIQKHFKQIYIVDISASLLEVARQRCEKWGLSDIVKIVECDITDSAVAGPLLPAPGTCDLVTMSYSLSMIPDKDAAISTSMSLLKPKGQGFLGVADFFLRDLKDEHRRGIKKALRRSEAALHRLWFKQDKVHLLSPEIVEKLTKDGKALEWDERFRGGVPFLPFLRPIHGALVVKSE